ncbi:von willebrand factor type A domain-containing protein [Phthorimaea operculella]|nr:von willebrand factor type A domain-containing protein [Phthorimaea operculella]
MDDIDQVKTKVDELFDAAYNSNSSKIENFIIVTFNDPDVKLRTKTKDRDVFKKALNDIQVDGGGDCPEMALTGLELALQEAREKSFVYLFTDASAKDDNKTETVQAMAKEKKCRLFFMVTGNCYDDKDHIYKDLAAETEGQVFNLEKKEIAQLLGYARETLAGGYAASVPLRRASAPAPAAFAESFSTTPSSGDTISEFELDEATKEVLVSVSGSDPEVTVTGPGGVAPKTQDIANTSGSKVFKILEAAPGSYTIVVKSRGPSSVIVNKKPVS